MAAVAGVGGAGFEDLRDAGMLEVAEQLLDEGVQAFGDSFKRMLADIEVKRAKIAG